jgi:hypothetical protein
LQTFWQELPVRSSGKSCHRHISITISDCAQQRRGSRLTPPADIVVFGVATLALIPLGQEARRPGQLNFEVEARFMLFGRRGARLKSALLPR